MEPREYATYFDRQFLSRGLALHRSLVRHDSAFRLWVLCLDAETHDALRALDLGGVELVPLAELERADPDLLAVKPSRAPLEYYWTCGPAFLHYLFARRPDIERLTYLDADVYFFGDPEAIHLELGDGSMLIVPHRVSGRKGLYNVGWVTFRRSSVATACLERWRLQCLDWCYDRVEVDRFGDQRYLDEWPARYPGTVVSAHTGACVARWNDLGVRRQGRQLMSGDDPLVFYHFSDLCRIWFRFFEGGPRLRGPMNRVVRHDVYDAYLCELTACEAVVDALDTEVRSVQPPDMVSSLRMLVRAWWGGSLVIVPARCRNVSLLSRATAVDDPESTVTG